LQDQERQRADRDPRSGQVRHGPAPGDGRKYQPAKAEDDGKFQHHGRQRAEPRCDEEYPEGPEREADGESGARIDQSRSAKAGHHARIHPLRVVERACRGLAAGQTSGLTTTPGGSKHAVQDPEGTGRC
jgi:hypothetical protein